MPVPTTPVRHAGVSVPDGAGTPGDGDGQGDAKVAGTKYHATSIIPCAGYKGAAAGTCPAGVAAMPRPARMSK